MGRKNKSNKKQDGSGDENGSSQRQQSQQSRNSEGQQPPRSGQQPPQSEQQPPQSGQQPPQSGQQPQRSGQQPPKGRQQQPQGRQQPPQSGQQPSRDGQQPQRSGQQPPQDRQQQPQGRQQQPQGRQQPPQSGQQPQRSGQQPPQDRQQQAQGRQQQPQGRQQQPQGRQQQPQGGQQPQGSQQLPQSGQQPPQGGQKPQRSGQQPPQGRQQQPQGRQQQPQGRQQQTQGRQQQPQCSQQLPQGGQQLLQSRQQLQWSGQQQPQGGWQSPQDGQQRAQQQQSQQQSRGPKSQQGAWQQQRQTEQRNEQSQQQGGWGQQQQPYRGAVQKIQQKGQERSLSQQMAHVSISEINFPNKPISCNGIARGDLGKQGTVEVNYLKLDVTNVPNEAYHYDVTIIPDRPKKFLRPVFEQCNRKIFPNTCAAYDGVKSCYTLERLKMPIDEKLEVPDSNGRMKEFQIQIKETDSFIVDLGTLRTYQNESVSDKPMRALQVLEIFLANYSHRIGIRVGRSFFRKPDKPYNLGDGYEAWTGLFQAAILGEEPFLNVDIAHKSFPCESTVLNYLKSNGVDLKMQTPYYKKKEISDYLKNLNILYTPPESFGSFPKNYKVLGIGDSADETYFENSEGNRITVANYFCSRGYPLQYPKLSCLQVGSSIKKIALPMELCFISAGQVLNRKDSERQTSCMVRYAATSTNIRKAKIMNLLHYFHHNNDTQLQSFGLKIGSCFIRVPMRLLPTPYMEYFNGQTVTTFKGAWRMEDRTQFFRTENPASGHKWAILYEDRKLDYHMLEMFKNNVTKLSQNLRMNLQNQANIQKYSYNNLEPELRKFAKEKYDLVFVVISTVKYAVIKQIAELNVGILTQCIKSKTVERCQRDKTVISNILLKVNGKLNGTNHIIAKEEDPRLKSLMSSLKKVMYLGADVTHPSPDQLHIPSVVGVAASHDQFGACYNCQYRLQISKKETIEDMESIVMRHLEVFKKYQQSYPDQIIYYRDGVSDGQFPQIRNEEVRSIHVACKKKNCSPKITCIIVVKRHHTRFFPLTQPKHERDFNNVEAGTVVDQHITHPNEKQFFMVSHQSIQGTARPTRYNVIVDESSFNINFLQKLTYDLCHLFPRCNRAVSYPAPAYLAHLVAFRGRVYLEGASRFDKNLRKEYENRLIKPEFLNRNPMYFI